jgi:hypothetical protein
LKENGTRNKNQEVLMTLKICGALAVLAGVLVVPAKPGENKIPPAGKAIKLFNGKNLDGFDTFLKTKGFNNDPGQGVPG